MQSVTLRVLQGQEQVIQDPIQKNIKEHSGLSAPFGREAKPQQQKLIQQEILQPLFPQCPSETSTARLWITKPMVKQSCDGT